MIIIAGPPRSAPPRRARRTCPIRNMNINISSYIIYIDINMYSINNTINVSTTNINKPNHYYYYYYYYY